MNDGTFTAVNKTGGGGKTRVSFGTAEFKMPVKSPSEDAKEAATPSRSRGEISASRAATATQGRVTREGQEVGLRTFNVEKWLRDRAPMESEDGLEASQTNRTLRKPRECLRRNGPLGPMPLSTEHNAARKVIQIWWCEGCQHRAQQRRSW